MVVWERFGRQVKTVLSVLSRLNRGGGSMSFRDGQGVWSGETGKPSKMASESIHGEAIDY